MDFVNRTAVPASCVLTDGGDDDQIGVVTAKATFNYDPRGGVELETQRPFALFDEDTPTGFGMLPRDDLPRDGDDFEVIFLGCAHAPGGRPIPAMEVSLAVGAVERRLAIFGRRVWTDEGPSAPEGFTTMPITWQNAFGGACLVEVDRGAPVIVTDPRNPAGKGFDPGPQARAIGAFLSCPAGYPVVAHERELPNVEGTGQRVHEPDDAPEPTCWATLPMASVVHCLRMVDLEQSQAEGRMVLTERSYFRAVPEWVIPRPPPGAEVALRGLDPAGDVRFALPALVVSADFDIGGARTTVPLAPQSLVIVGEQRRATLTYRAHFHMRRADEVEKSARLRVERA